MDEPSYFQNALSNFVTDAACGGAVRHLVDIGYTLDQIVDRLDYPAPRAKVQRIMMEYLYESRVLLREEPSAELFAAKETFVQEQDAFGRRSMRKISIDLDSQNRQNGVSEAQSRPFAGSHPGYAISDSNLTVLSNRQKLEKTQKIIWKESVYDSKRDGKLTELLHRKCEKNGEVYSYVSCPFGELKNDQYSQNGQNRNDGLYRQGESGESAKPSEERSITEEKLACLNSRQRDYIQGIRWDQPVLYHRLNQRMLEIIGKLYEAGVYSGAAFFMASGEKLVIPLKQPSV